MTSNPFDRVIWNTREKPLSPDWNRALTQEDYSLRLIARELYTGSLGLTSTASPVSGFIGYGFSVQPQASPNMTVVLKSGLGFIDNPTDAPTSINGVAGLDDALSYKPILLTQDTTISIPARPVSNQRIDLIEVRANRQVTDLQSRLILDPTTGAFNPNTVAKTLQNTVDGSIGFVSDPSLSTAAVSYKQGAAAVSPIAPTPTPGYLPVALIRVGSSTTTIPFSLISDQRRILAQGGVMPWSASWNVVWNAGAPLAFLLASSVPPPLQVACATQTPATGPVKGTAVFTVTGGLVQSCPMTFSVGIGQGATEVSNTEMLLATRILIPGLDGGIAGPANASPTFGVVNVPQFNTGDFSNVVVTRVSARHVSTAVDITSTLLENLTFHVNGVCRW